VYPCEVFNNLDKIIHCGILLHPAPIVNLRIAQTQALDYSSLFVKTDTNVAGPTGTCIHNMFYKILFRCICIPRVCSTLPRPLLVVFVSGGGDIRITVLVGLSVCNSITTEQIYMKFDSGE